LCCAGGLGILSLFLTQYGMKKFISSLGIFLLFSQLVFADYVEHDLVDVLDESNFVMTSDHDISGDVLFVEVGEDIVFTAEVLSDEIPLYNEDESPNMITIFGSGSYLECDFVEGAVRTCTAMQSGSVEVYFEVYDIVIENGLKNRFVTNSIEVIVGGGSTCADFKSGFDSFYSEEHGNRFVPGTAVYETEEHDDYCKDEGVLVEYSCDESGLKEEEIVCVNGCGLGACNEDSSFKPDYVVEDIKVENYDCGKCGETMADLGTIIPAYKIFAKIKNNSEVAGEGELKLNISYPDGTERNWSNMNDNEFELYGLGANEYASTPVGYTEGEWGYFWWVKQSDVSNDGVITVTIDPDNLIEETNEINNTYSRTIGAAFQEVEAAPGRNPFSDVDAESEEGKAAIYLYDRDVIDGNPDGSFDGDDPINRAEVAKVLLRTRSNMFVAEIGDETGYTDVPSSVWYARFVVRATELGIVSGYPDKTFRGGDAVNVAEFAKMLSLALELAVPEEDSSPWYQKYFDALEEYDLSFLEYDPLKEMTRSEVAVGIYQLLSRQ